MAKPFFDVFSTLEVKGKLRNLFEDTSVERVVNVRQKDFLRVYISSGHIIPKADVYAMEAQIKNQLFAKSNTQIKLYERFSLSAQYTPKQVLDVYFESILQEFLQYGHVEYYALKGASVSFPAENQVIFTLSDSTLIKDRAEDIRQILEKILVERFGFSVAVEVAFAKAKKTSSLAEEEHKVAMRVARIAEGLGTDGPGQAAPEMQFADGATAQKNAAPEADVLRTQSMENKAPKSMDGLPAPSGAGTAQKAEGKSKDKSGTKTAGKNSSPEGKTSDAPKRSNYGALKRSDAPDVIFGRDFEDEAMPIAEIVGEMGVLAIRGKVLKLDVRDIRNEKSIVIFDMTDFSDTISVKIFIQTEQVPELKQSLKEGGFYKIKGVAALDRYDHELSIASIQGIKKIPDFTTKRSDDALYKRVELHCHTKMSDMDGVSEAKSLIKRAHGWGHRALAITDHGVVQAFTEAGHVWDDLWKAEKEKRKAAGEENPDKQDFFKILYGCEIYLVDDLKTAVMEDAGQTFADTFVVFDIETTGFSPVKDRIIEIGAVKVENGVITDRFSTFVNPERPIPYEIEKLTSITDAQVLPAPTIEVILPKFLEFVKDAVLVAHNASFDMSFIQENCRRLGVGADFTYVDTLALARTLLPNQGKHTLDAVAKTLMIGLANHHRAVDDAECTAHIFVKFMQLLEAKGIQTLHDANELTKASPEAIRRLPSYHCIVLAKNDLGRIHLYKLVSESHLNYFQKRPKVPKSLIEKYRDGLIIGSACEAGELYRALLDGQSDTQIARLVQFYDYLEIQPRGNNEYMIASPKVRSVESMEDILKINKQIVTLGEQFHKPVVATCDVHFLDPEDEVYRRIIMAGQGFEDADHQAPLYLHNTQEMLDEFAYLGSDKAREVVITNPNRIADMVETIAPVRPDKCPPQIPGSDQMLRDICYDKAHEIYGPTLPAIVSERLERELHSIISNGYAVMYIIAQKLVWKSVEDGYLVGSRGSVGSSFVATMAGITEVNPLSPHYICPNCYYADFDSEDVKKFAGMAGVDMPDCDCPKCGTKMNKDGFDIPFETFLGFKGDKEPDIDLNFSGEYQSRAHKYTEVIFGTGQTFRAGTIGTLADKTAFGFVKKYFEERDVHKRHAEVERLAGGCTGIRRSTGQHPGGIIVLPVGEEIASFTPIQHPANDMSTDTVTTHFDYHAIDHNLLKLDILGHDDPTMIRALQDMTGRDPLTIPLDGKDVMSLFQNTSALGITPDDIGGTPLGALGIPEFGTDFAMQMVIEAAPTSFSDLVRIAGLAHGTDVWLGNAQDLIKSGTATISTAICTRDDIMTYLISKGVEPEKSFKIMENVRKGAVAKGKCGQWPEWKADMKAHDVPDWYIGSCEKIMYMFPKAHAAAYVMMAWRIAYCKIHYPLAYYGAFFGIRAKAFSYEIMCQGRPHLERIMEDYRRRKDSLSNKEEAAYGDMRIVQEMYARGFEFTPIDIFKAKAKAFQIIDGKLMPSLNSIDGLGEKAADSIVEAAKQGPFLSKEDFRDRTKVSKTITDLMASLGLLGNLPESNQISLFDFL